MNVSMARRLVVGFALSFATGCLAPSAGLDGGGASDAGNPRDAGADAGTAAMDAGRLTDAGTTDGGAVDAGVPDAGPAAPSSVAYSPSTASCVIGESCTIAAPQVTGGLGIFTSTPGLPSGLLLDPVTGAISGAASVTSARADYAIQVTNAAGSASTTLPLEVTEHPPTGLTYLSSALVCTIGVPCTLGPPGTSGGPIRSFSVSPALPSGLSMGTTTAVITGTGTSLGVAQSYTVTAENSGGSTTTAVTISVVEVPPSSLQYAVSSLGCGRGAPCTLGPPTVTGNVTSYSTSPTLPMGMSISRSGMISGSPTVTSAAQIYLVRATNTGGSATFSLLLTVFVKATILSSVDISPLSNLNVFVGGVTEYRSKIVADAGACADLTGYSTSTPVATRITDPVIEYVDTTVTLCVLGSDGTTWQPEAYSTTSSLVDATLIKTGSATTALEFVRVVDVDAGAYAMATAIFTADGGLTSSATCAGCEVSTDLGATWSTMVPDAGNKLVVHVRHAAAATPNTETDSTLTWAGGGVWTFASFTKAAECLPSAKRIFISESTHNGQFVPFSSADDFCQAEAGAYGVGGTWHAMLSTASTKLALLEPSTTYCSLEGRQLVVNRAFVAPMVRRVSGKNINPGVTYASKAHFPYKPRTENSYYWVGDNSASCSGWTANTGPAQGWVAGINWGDSGWGWYGLQAGGIAQLNCDGVMRLMCFES